MIFQPRTLFDLSNAENVSLDTTDAMRVSRHKASVVRMELELEHYTPSEAEDITLVPQTTVRNWRRAGHLPRNEGHARYTVRELLVMTSMRSLVAKGVLPEVAKAFAPEVANAAFQALIHQPNAFSSGLHSLALDKVAPMPSDYPQRFKSLLDSAGGAEVLSDAEIERIWRSTCVQTTLTDAAQKAFGTYGLKKPSWFIIWANDEIQFYYDEDISDEKFFGETAWDEYVEGPVTLFCLGAVATMVLKRLPRPAIKLAGRK